MNRYLLRKRLEQNAPDKTTFRRHSYSSDAEIKQGTWLATPLWNEFGWKHILGDHGITWQQFVSTFGTVQYEFVKWRRGKATWDDAMARFIDELTNV